MEIHLSPLVCHRYLRCVCKSDPQTRQPGLMELHPWRCRYDYDCDYNRESRCRACCGGDRAPGHGRGHGYYCSRVCNRRSRGHASHPVHQQEVHTCPEGRNGGINIEGAMNKYGVYHPPPPNPLSHPSRPLVPSSSSVYGRAQLTTRSAGDVLGI